MLINLCRNKTPVIGKVKIADSFLKRLRGLMFSREKDFDYALVFPFGFESRQRASIHMLFVFFPTDLVFLNNEKKVVDIVHGIKPFTPMYVPKKAASYVVELPRGKAGGISEGDALSWDRQHAG